MARDITVLTEAELRRCVPLDLEAVGVVEDAFRALAQKPVAMPPVLSMMLEDVHGEVDVKTAYIPGLEGFAIKVSPGFFNNPKIGLPSLNGLMILLSARTGLVDTLLLDNGYLTDMRTAAAGAVAAKYLAPPAVGTAGVIGAGVQARLQIAAARLVRPFGKVLVWARDPERAAACALEIASDLGIDARPEHDPARLLAESQLVVTTTPAREPVFSADWLHPGLHVTAMGSDQAGKNEIDPNALAAVDLYVADRASQCAQLGELRSAIAAGLMRANGVTELGEIVAGLAHGRLSDDAMTIADLTGTGAQDTAIANFASHRARAAKLGMRIAV
jgi:ornithine cyclodeaminase